MEDSGRPFFSTCRILLGFMLLTALSSGCQSLPFDPKAHIVPESSWIALSPDGEHSGAWTNEDMILNYRLVRNQSRLRIIGSIQFSDRITKTYLIVQYFHLDVIPVDTQGRVLDMIGLISAAGVNTIFDHSLEFDRTLTLPSNSEAIAFSYRGRTAGTRDAGTMDFWEYPVY